MPRPKRSKMASAARTPTPRAVTPPASTLPIATTDRDTTSSDSDGLVIAKPGTLKRRSGDDLPMMSGGLGRGEQRPPHATPRTKRRRVELSRVAREADHAKALEGLKKRRAEEEERRRNEGKQGDVDVFDESKKQAAVAVQNESERQNDTTNSVEEESEQQQQTGERKTSAAMDSSMMVIANFKRRPRQPSILRMVQAEQERENENEKSDEDNMGLDLDLGMDEFKPEDESTPFQVRHVSDTQPERSVSPTTDAGAEAGQEGDEARRTSPAVETPTKEAEASTTERDTSRAKHASVEEVEDVDLPNHVHYEATEASPPPEVHRESTPMIWSDTMAPPASSSSGHIQAADVPKKNQTRQASPSASRSPRNNKKKDSPSPRTTRPPQNRTKPAENKINKPTQSRKKEKKTSMTTAALQDFLPRRRRRGGQRQVRAGAGQNRKQDEFEIFSTSTSLDEGMDEEEDHEDGRDANYRVNGQAARKRTGGTAPKQPATHAPKGKNPTTKRLAHPSNNNTRGTTNVELSTHTSPPLSSSPALSSSDKENHLTPSAKLAQLTRAKSTTTTTTTRAANGSTKKAFNLGMSPLSHNTASKVPKKSGAGANGTMKTPAVTTTKTKRGGSKIPAGVQKTNQKTKKAPLIAKTPLTTHNALRSRTAKDGEDGGRKPLAPTTNVAISQDSDASTEHGGQREDQDEVTDPDEEENGGGSSAAKRTYSKQTATITNKPKKAAAITGGAKKMGRKKEDAGTVEHVMENEGKKSKDVSRELIEQGRKFQEVDQWELCFEDVDTVSS